MQKQRRITYSFIPQLSFLQFFRIFPIAPTKRPEVTNSRPSFRIRAATINLYDPLIDY